MALMSNPPKRPTCVSCQTIHMHTGELIPVYSSWSAATNSYQLHICERCNERCCANAGWGEKPEKPAKKINKLSWEEYTGDEPCRSMRGRRGRVECERERGHPSHHAGRGKIGQWFAWL